MKQIKDNLSIFNFYYCKDFIAIRKDYENKLFLFDLPSERFLNLPGNNFFNRLYYIYKINLGPQFASIHAIGNKINFTYCYNGDIVSKNLNIKFTRFLKIIENLTKEKIENEKFKKITMETE